MNRWPSGSRITPGPLLGIAAAAAVLPLLGGCAVAVLPVLAGGGLIGRQATQSEMPEPETAERADSRRAAAADAAAVAAAAARTGVGSGRGASLASESSPGEPSAEPAASPAGAAASARADAAPPLDPAWAAFVDYALAHAIAAPGERPASVLLALPASLSAPRFQPCGTRPPSVLIDLDGPSPVRAEQPFTAAPGLPAALRRLREAGIAIVWLAQSAADEAALGAALQRSRLDQARRDALLVADGADESKQALRTKAGQSACVIAIAGDRMGDFDELFDYLRDPASGNALKAKLGAGWFLVPPPLG